MRSAVSTTSAHYSWVAILLHWLIALAIFALLAIGLSMTRMAPGMTMFKLFQFHKSLGITVLVLSLLRVLWRLGHRAPPLPADTAPAEAFAAHAMHVLLYVLMLGMPLTGWALVSTSAMHLPTVLYTVLPLPDLPLDGLGDKAALNGIFQRLHDAGGWVMLAAALAHVGAALFHQFIRRDEVMGHMAPWLARRAPRGIVRRRSA